MSLKKKIFTVIVSSLIVSGLFSLFFIPGYAILFPNQVQAVDSSVFTPVDVLKGSAISGWKNGVSNGLTVGSAYGVFGGIKIQAINSSEESLIYNGYPIGYQFYSEAFAVGPQGDYEYSQLYGVYTYTFHQDVDCYVFIHVQAPSYQAINQYKLLGVKFKGAVNSPSAYGITAGSSNSSITCFSEYTDSAHRYTAHIDVPYVALYFRCRMPSDAPDDGIETTIRFALTSGSEYIDPEVAQYSDLDQLLVNPPSGSSFFGRVEEFFQHFAFIFNSGLVGSFLLVMSGGLAFVILGRWVIHL